MNLSTILVGLVLALVIGLIIFKMIRDRRAGKSSCGCGCSTCAAHDSCHTASRKG